MLWTMLFPVLNYFHSVEDSNVDVLVGVITVVNVD